jgi:hypothetical protein
MTIKWLSIYHLNDHQSTINQPSINHQSTINWLPDWCQILAEIDYQSGSLIDGLLIKSGTNQA